jgi:hypothetical protein
LAHRVPRRRGGTGRERAASSGFGSKYVRDTKVEFVQVTEDAPIGADAGEKGSGKSIWLRSNDPRLKLPNVHRTDAEPISWTNQEVIEPVKAWEAMRRTARAATCA